MNYKKITQVFWVLHLLFLSIPLHAQSELTIGTYNIRCPAKADIKSDNLWHNRIPYICNLILFYDFDIIGLQEVHTCQLDSLSVALTEYTSIGADSKDSKLTGVYNKIFYKKDKLELLDSGDFWLSETPDSVSIGWDAKNIRICSWGLFKLISTGKNFLFYNTHLDHKGEAARQLGVELILKRIKQLGMCDNIIFVGDLNSSQYSQVYDTIVHSGFLEDSYTKAKIVHAYGGTYTGFKPTKYRKERGDHIFVSNNMYVKRFGILTDYYWKQQIISSKDSTENKYVEKSNYVQKLPSDHYPILIKITLD